MVMNLACVLMHMTMPEALAAATINAAASLGLSDRRGSLEVGKAADMIILNTKRWVYLSVWFSGFNSHSIITQVGALSISVWLPPKSD